jgi:hypothetical protein
MEDHGFNWSNELLMERDDERREWFKTWQLYIKADGPESYRALAARRIHESFVDAPAQVPLTGARIKAIVEEGAPLEYHGERVA